MVPNYVGKLMGDSPEMTLLDSLLFCDLIEKVAWLVVSTARLDGDEKYTMTTPNQAWRIMVASWEMVPEERIVVGVRRFV